jgi:hypothetical protein
MRSNPSLGFFDSMAILDLEKLFGILPFINGKKIEL